MIDTVVQSMLELVRPDLIRSLLNLPLNILNTSLNFSNIF